MVGVSAAIVCCTFGPWSCAANGYSELRPGLRSSLVSILLPRTRLEPRLKPMPPRFSILPRNVAYLARLQFFADENEGGSARNRVVFIKRVHSRSHFEKQCGSEK